MTIPATLTSDEARARRGRTDAQRFFLYALGFVLVQVCLLLAILSVASTRWFLAHDDDAGMRSFGYVFRIGHADCQVVLYGDSSAEIGLDPAVVQKVAGLKTCNLSEAGWIEDVVGTTYPLNYYLSHNKRPLYMVMMFTPSMFEPYRPPFSNYRFNGVLYELQYNRHAKVYWELLKRPKWLLDFDLWAGHAMIEHFLDRELFPDPGLPPMDGMLKDRSRRMGWWRVPWPPETHCVRDALHLGPGSISSYPASVAKMRKLYSVGGTKVLIDMTPVPTCDLLQNTYRKRAAGLQDNKFETLPISYFGEGDVHASLEGSRYISTEVGEQILALENMKGKDGEKPAK